MSQGLRLALPDEDSSRLDRLASEWGRSRAEAAAQLIHEKLAEEEFPAIEFRTTAIGRQAYVRNSRVQVWMLLLLARSYDMDAARIAEHLGWAEETVRAGLAYSRAHPEAVEPVTDAVQDTGFDDLKRVLPRLHEVPQG